MLFYEIFDINKIKFLKQNIEYTCTKMDYLRNMSFFSGFFGAIVGVFFLIRLGVVDSLWMLIFSWD